jgi:hypothetical protein
MLERCFPCLTIDFFQTYFDISTNEIQERLVASLIPFNRMFITKYKQKPDLYGPFWIYTTLIIIVAIAGNLNRYFEMRDTLGGEPFTYNFNFIPIAATIIYSIGFGLPVILKALMKLLGSNFFSGTFIEVISFHIYIYCDFRSWVYMLIRLQAS